MKIYCAGNEEGIPVYRYVYILKNGMNQLYSFFKFLTSLKSEKMKKKIFDLGRPKDQKNISIFLDSGAFSAWSKGVDININEYIEFIKENEKFLDVYAVLDDIKNAEKTLENQKIMEKAGLNPLPCFHYGEDLKYLNYYINNYNYIALGGMVPINNKDLQPWLDNLFQNYLCDKEGIPKIKVHGFGMTSFRLMRRYPWYSVDSTSWIMTSRMGGILIPPKQNNKWSYEKDPWKICVSEKSPNVSDHGKHISTMQPEEVKQLNEYIEEKGFTIELLSKEYVQRDLANLEYFKDFEKAQPEWPWPYKRKRGAKSFL